MKKELEANYKNAKSEFERNRAVLNWMRAALEDQRKITLEAAAVAGEAEEALARALEADIESVSDEELEAVAEIDLHAHNPFTMASL